MVMTDPIADMLTRIRNANQRKHEEVLAIKVNEESASIIIMSEELMMGNT